jgi:hypothetical protein
LRPFQGKSDQLVALVLLFGSILAVRPGYHGTLDTRIHKGASLAEVVCSGGA